MKSTFSTFFWVNKLLLSIVALIFFSLPIAVVFVDSELEHSIMQPIIVAVLCWPFIPYFIRQMHFTRIHLSPTHLTISKWNHGEVTYCLTDIASITCETYKIEGVQRGYDFFYVRNAVPDINYEPQATILFKDNHSIILHSDVYANIQKIVDYIELYLTSPNPPNVIVELGREKD
jgi:hypothetical protein